MKIKLELFGASRDFSKEDYLEFNLKEKSSIKDLRTEILNFVENNYHAYFIKIKCWIQLGL